MDNENKYGTKAVQEELLSMMKDLHAFFEREGIRYSLAYGSLLGCIRHEGFIPWDDDMDIMVDRENYEKILRVFRKLEGYSICKTLWIYRIRKVSALHDKHAPTIDIFVFDNVPANALVRSGKLFCLKILQGMLKPSVDYSKYAFLYSVALRLTHIAGMLFPEKLKQFAYDKISQLGNARETQSVAIYNSSFECMSRCFPKSVLLSDLKKRKFEDALFYVLENWDCVLSVEYGDYMTPPPEENRIPTHL